MFLTCLQPAQRLLQRPTRCWQEATLGDEGWFWTCQQEVLTLSAQPANHSGEGRGQ